MSDDIWFERLIDTITPLAPDRAPASLKSRLYSALVERMSETGPLLDLSATKKAGGQLCVFENSLTLLPVATDIPAMNPCRICHARVLGERMTHAPIFWRGCPYSEFHRG